MVVPGGGAVSYERGTLVDTRALLQRVVRGSEQSVGVHERRRAHPVRTPRDYCMSNTPTHVSDPPRRVCQTHACVLDT